ncbi:hypothetical protein HRL69_004070 [Salmonella enterica]|nr:hypothetical protein [Salmonella enterica]
MHFSHHFTSFKDMVVTGVQALLMLPVILMMLASALMCPRAAGAIFLVLSGALFFTDTRTFYRGFWGGILDCLLSFCPFVLLVCIVGMIIKFCTEKAKIPDGDS